MKPLSPDTVPLGKHGIPISPIAWGMWRFAGQDVISARALIEAAFEAGITLFDTADIYGFDGTSGFGDAETLLGRVLAESPGLRERMVLATKGGIDPGIPYDSSSDYLAGALDASLRRMRTDRVELWQVHRPDLLTHPEALAQTLVDMVASGKVGAIGVSNFTVAQIRSLQAFLPFPLVSTQPQFSALHTAPIWNGDLDVAMELGLSVLAWSPLGGGRLGEGGKVTTLLEAKAQSAQVSLGAAAYAWIMAHPATPIPIVGSQQPARIREAADAFEVEWSRAEWYAVLQASTGERLP